MSELRIIRLQKSDPAYSFQVYPDLHTILQTPPNALIVARVHPVPSQIRQGLYNRFTVESGPGYAFDTFTMDVREHLFANTQFQLLLLEISNRLSLSIQSKSELFVQLLEPSS